MRASWMEALPRRIALPLAVTAVALLAVPALAAGATVDGQSLRTDVEKFDSFLPFSVDPDSAAFGRQTTFTSSPTRTFTIMNQGSFDHEVVEDIVLTGTDPRNF